MKKDKIAVIGLGYVGLPVANIFATKYNVIGYDINVNRVESLNNYIDDTLEISRDQLKNSLDRNLSLTHDISELKECNIYIITVPTPINKDKSPNLTPLTDASAAVGKILFQGDIVIYESTVFPKCTEEVCVPILEKSSKLRYNIDFFCGYSPERINPGDKNHTIEKIVKVTSGSTPKIAERVDQLYSSVIDAGTYKASSIEVAEAAKVIENSQRDINIAFMNELAKIFDKMDIDTNEVLNAASTKWNFLNFQPGLVGGHCIGVDPYYLATKSQSLGFNPEIILSGRKINDSMGKFVADKVYNLLKADSTKNKKLNILILGVTFKENCPDYRNTKVIDIIKRFQEFQLNIDVFDPWIKDDNFEKKYKIKILKSIPKEKYNAIVLAVAHNAFKEIDIVDLKVNKNSIVYDIKGFLDKKLTTNRL